MTRHQALEAVLFPLAMAVLATAIGGAMYGLILAAGVLLRGFYWIAAATGLPPALCLALVVMLTAFLVGTFVPRGLAWVGDHWPKRSK